MTLMLLLNAGIYISLCKMVPATQFASVQNNDSSVPATQFTIEHNNDSSDSVLHKKDTADSSVQRLLTCKNDWIHKGKYCYKLETHRMTWEHALCYCLRKGGNLASIHSEEQQGFITDNIYNEVSLRLWIGLHDTGFEGEYVWDDGSSLDYTKWAPNEPTGFKNRQEDCVEMRHDIDAIGTWNDAPCNIEKAFICQKGAQKKEHSNKGDSHSSAHRKHHTKHLESVSSGSVSVTTFVITIMFIIALMAEMGGIFYYRRLWMEEKCVKFSPVVFKNEVQDAELLTDVDIKHDDSDDDPRYIRLK